MYQKKSINVAILIKRAQQKFPEWYLELWQKTSVSSWFQKMKFSSNCWYLRIYGQKTKWSQKMFFFKMLRLWDTFGPKVDIFGLMGKKQFFLRDLK